MVSYPAGAMPVLLMSGAILPMIREMIFPVVIYPCLQLLINSVGTGTGTGTATGVIYNQGTLLNLNAVVTIAFVFSASVVVMAGI
jgi:hypothetical protein